MLGCLHSDAAGVGKYLEAVVAGDGDQHDAGVFGGAQGECGWGRDRGDDGRAADSSLLDHLDRDAAGHQDGAGIGRYVAAGEGADQLVERIVPSDILAQSNNSALRRPESRRMDRAGFPIRAANLGSAKIPSLRS
jgi:hypothetical protein